MKISHILSQTETRCLRKAAISSKSRASWSSKISRSSSKLWEPLTTCITDQHKQRKHLHLATGTVPLLHRRLYPGHALAWEARAWLLDTSAAQDLSPTSDNWIQSIWAWLTIAALNFPRYEPRHGAGGRHLYIFMGTSKLCQYLGLIYKKLLRAKSISQILHAQNICKIAVCFLLMSS